MIRAVACCAVLLVTVLAFLATLIGLARTAENPFMRLLSNATPIASCPSYCWHGVTPGKTSYAELAQILAADPLVSNVSTHFGETSSMDSVCVVSWTATVGSARLRACAFSNFEAVRYSDHAIGTLQFVPESSASQPARLGDLIGVYGLPSGLSMGGYYGGSASTDLFMTGGRLVQVVGNSYAPQMSAVRIVLFAFTSDFSKVPCRPFAKWINFRVQLTADCGNGDGS